MSSALHTFDRVENLEGQDGSRDIKMQSGLLVQSSDTEAEASQSLGYITGWRLHVITLGLCLGLFLINFEITIVSTAISPIINALESFEDSSWIITAYLCTYIAGLVISAMLSDFFGRKSTLLVCLFIFTVFSGGCGAAQTIVQLIVCRVFQGIGGSGIYSLSMVMLYELVPPPKYPMYTAMATGIIVLAFALGPILGGLITDSSVPWVWRWVFLCNCPAGIISGAIILFTVPNGFPNHETEKSGVDLPRPAHRQSSPSKGVWETIDFTGAFLILVALILLLTGLQQASSSLDWTSPSTLAPLCISAPVWLAFFARQYFVSRPGSPALPVLPWEFLCSRSMIGLLLNQLMTGAVNITCFFQIPLRYQISGLSPLQAGVRLVPFAICGPIGAIITSLVSKNRRVPPIYAAMAGAILQVLGLIFISRSPDNSPDWRPMYGLEVITGLGFGANIGSATLLIPYLVEKKNLATGTGAVTQFRFLGSAVAISIVTAVGNNWVKDRILSEALLSPLQLESLFQSTQVINTFPSSVQIAVRSLFIRAFDLEMKIVLGFAVASVFASLLMWQRVQITVP